jgi:hypothetical protein
MVNVRRFVGCGCGRFRLIELKHSQVDIECSLRSTCWPNNHPPDGPFTVFGF